MNPNQTYDEVIKWYREIALIGRILGQLYWDQRVNLPPKGVASRAEQIAYMEGFGHRKLIDPDMVKKVHDLAGESDALSEDAKINIREIKREVDRATKVPTSLVEEISRHVAKSNAAWVEARKNNDFPHFAPFLEKMLDLRKQEAAALGFADNPYDAALDFFEPGATEEQVRELLADLRGRLVPFLHKVLDKERREAKAILGKTYPIDAQRRFGLKVVAEMGYDFDGGRQDISAHPFTVGEKGDVRITTRFNENDLRQSIFAMFHEAGHGMYEQGTPDEHLDTPLGHAVSLAVHESQSRFWENIVGRSRPFWKHYFPMLQQEFSTQLGDVPLEEFYRAVNTVTPSLIRVEADEVTYNMHIVLRFEIERAFMAGEVKVGDLPALWNQKMKEYLEIDVPQDADGVLQDVHWSEGLIGYFPTYTMGNLYSAQLRAKMKSDLGDFAGLIEAGDFAPILKWLRENIHQHGKRYRAADLIERATGEKPTAQPFMNYLQEKYGELYDL